MSEPKHITQIISLPRSRTAWLSVAMSFGDCFGFHDGCNPPGTTAKEYFETLNSPRQKYVVDCSSHLVMRHDLVEAANCPIIIIDRDIEPVRESLRKHIGEDAALIGKIWPHIEWSFGELRKKFASRITLNIAFDDLARSGVIESIYGEATRHTGEFDRLRIENLQNLNIQERKPIWAGV